MISRPPPAPHLKVLTYNIHKGFTRNNRAHILEPIRRALRAIDPDLVFLQEVLGEHTRHRKRIPDWPEAPQCEYLAQDVWPHFAYGRNAVYLQGHHGNAVLSKFPILQWENLDVSNSRLESRGILHGKVKLPGSAIPLHFFCLHLDLLERGRRPQIQALCNRINAVVPEKSPLLIGGDFNDWRVRATATLERQTGVQEAFRTFHRAHARSFPSRRPFLKLDRIYFRGAALVNAAVLDGPPWNSLSDHLPLVCEFSL